MLHEYSRTELLVGTEGLNQLRSRHILVFGIGGVGSHCAEALARSGVGKLSLVDGDTVSLTNINRQSIALHSTVGKEKTQVMKEKIADISPSCQVFPWQTFVLPQNLGELMENIQAAAGQRPDYIIDAIDTSVCPLCRVMRKELKKRGIPALKVLYSREEPLKPFKLEGQEETAKKGRPIPGSISFVPPVAGLLMAGEVIRELLGR